MHRTKYFAPLPGTARPKTGQDLFDQLECRVITSTPRPRWPRRVGMVERVRRAWNTFWHPGPR